jgi:tRNA modification GTPase
LFGPIHELRERLLDLVAHLEANLDFAEEPDVDPLGRWQLAESLEASAAELALLSDRLRTRERPDARPRVVLVGVPNAGKSRLFNALLGDDRALVSPIAGTTRDYVTGETDCDGLTVELIDTAGDEEARNAIEDQAQSLRADQAARADLLIHCIPADSEHEPSNSNLPTDRPVLLVRTKSDMTSRVIEGGDALATSAATGEGLDELRSAIALRLRGQDEEGDLVSTTGARCADSLQQAGRALRDASTTIRGDGGDELVAIDLRLAIDELGKVVGAVVTDDILDRVFRRFCIGK